MGKRVAGGPKKHWSIHDLKSIKPCNPTQKAMFVAFDEGKHIIAYGSAGTGKTFIGLYLALCAALQTNNEIIIVRSAVQARDMGFLPGTVEEKMDAFEAPYHDILHEIIGRPNTYDDMKRAGLIRFVPTSFLRGLTWNDAIIIVDEGQNLTFHEIHSIMTRIGQNSTLIFIGDTAQTDLTRRNDKSGLEQMLRICANMPSVELIKFTSDDIVRGQFVKEWIQAVEGHSLPTWSQEEIETAKQKAEDIRKSIGWK